KPGSAWGQRTAAPAPHSPAAPPTLPAKADTAGRLVEGSANIMPLFFAGTRLLVTWMAATLAIVALRCSRSAGGASRHAQTPIINRAMNFPDRYSRQVLFPGIGAEGQQKLAAARVAIVGCGATGTCVAGSLGRAGVGQLRIIDRDFVEPSNLQRQSLFDEADAAESLPKAVAAAKKISAFNSQVQVQAEVADLTPENIHALLQGQDLLLDATDNFETRYLINDFAVKHGVPWIYAAAVAAYAVTMNIIPGETACLACMFPAPPQGTVETCDTAGILNSAVNLVASIQATEAIK